MSTSSKADIKGERVLKALNNEEPDRVPITDFFWIQFIKSGQPNTRLEGQKLPKEMGKRSSIKRLHMGSVLLKMLIILCLRTTL